MEKKKKRKNKGVLKTNVELKVQAKENNIVNKISRSK